MAELIGSNIDPRLFVQDYAPYERANLQAQQGIADNISSAMRTMIDYGKEQKESKNALKASQAQIEAAMTLFPDQAEYLGKISNELKNEDAPLSERAAVASGISEMIMMGVGQKRYENEQGFREREMSMRERESSMNQGIAGMEWTRELAKDQQLAAQSAADQEIKGALGPGLLQSVIQMAPPGITNDIRKNIDSGEYTSGEQFDIANKIMGLLPKKERARAPSVQDVSVPGGTQKMQWDEDSASFVPIQVDIPGADASGQIYTDPNASDEELGMVLPPINSGVGFTPTPKDTTGALALQRFEKDQADAAAKKGSDIAASQSFVNALETLEKHPGFSNLFGTNVGVPTWLPGSSGADAKALYEQIQGKGFLEAIQGMKGMGALSNAEGEKVSAAFLGLKPSMSEAAAKSRIEEAKKIIKEGIARVQASGGVIQGQAPIDPKTTASDRLRGLLSQ